MMSLHVPSSRGTYEYLRLERKLAAELIRLWRESYEKAVADLFKSLPATISKDAVDIITSSLSSALGPAFRSSPKVRQNVQKYIRQTYEKAKSEFKADAHFTLPDSRAVEVLKGAAMMYGAEVKISKAGEGTTAEGSADSCPRRVRR